MTRGKVIFLTGTRADFGKLRTSCLQSGLRT